MDVVVCGLFSRNVGVATTANRAGDLPRSSSRIGLAPSMTKLRSASRVRLSRSKSRISAAFDDARLGNGCTGLLYRRASPPTGIDNPCQGQGIKEDRAEKPLLAP